MGHCLLQARAIARAESGVAWSQLVRLPGMEVDMTRWLLGVCAAVASSAFCVELARSQDGIASSLNEGLVAHYSFDQEDPGSDVTGHGWDGVIGGYTLVTGIVDQAVAFDGTGGMVVEGFRDFAWGDAMSISLWILKRDNGGYAPIMGNSLDNDFSWVIQSGGESGGQAIWVGLETGQPNQFYDFPPATATFGKWHHLALVYNGSSSTFLLDGVPMLPIRSDAGPVRSMGTPLQLGLTSFQGEWRRARIWLDEVRIYNRALSSDEINRLGADASYASSAPSEMIAAIRKVSAGVLRPSAAGGSVVSSSGSGGGLTPSSAPRGNNDLTKEKPQASVWWTEGRKADVLAGEDGCEIYRKWIDLWRKGEKRVVIDELNRMSQ